MKSRTSAAVLPARQNRRSLSFLLFLGLLLIGSAIALRPAKAETLTLVTGTDYAPYTSPSLPGGGVVTETVMRVLSEMGYETNLQYYPWKRGFQRVASGASDITFPYAKSDERERQVLYSRPVNRIVVRLFYNARKPVAFAKPEDLAGLTYCEPLGYQPEPVIAALIKEGRLGRAEAQTMDNCIQLLAQHNVDFLVTNELVARAAARRVLGQRADRLVKAADKPVNMADEYMILSRRHPDGPAIIAHFNETYQRLYDQGVIQEIWHRHLGDVIQPPL